MIIGKISPGSGLGDQLFTYITTRTIALDKGYDYGFVGKEFFKGKDFMQFDWGKQTGLHYIIEHPTQKLVLEDESKIWEPKVPYYDPEVNFIEDGTVIDATCAQDERYWGYRLNEIREWLTTNKPLNGEMSDDVCIINFRGGEYATVSDLFLPLDYWNEAIGRMAYKYPNIKFEVHTDDEQLASKFFAKNFLIVRDIGLNWKSVRYAKHLILSNSAFGILPALLNENVKEVIAPKYWLRNTGKWRPMNYYKKFTYI